MPQSTDSKPTDSQSSDSQSSDSQSNDSVSPSRRIALRHLKRVTEDDAYVGSFGDTVDDARDRRQARELVAGVTRQRRWLDFLLAEFYNGDYEGMETTLRLILQLGLYELLFQHTPRHAAVHEYVELAKQELRHGAGGLVNGVLRAILRQEDDLPAPSTGNDAEDLAIRHSHPSWMAQRWVERFGTEDATELLEWNNKRPAYGLRVNTTKTTVEDVEAWLNEHDVAFIRSPYLDDVLRVDRLQAVVQSDLFDRGLVAVQDEGAVLVVQALAPEPGDTVVDACAAPGGKTLAVATRMKGKGRILAVDVHEGRLSRVQSAADDHGFGDVIETRAADLRDVAEDDDPVQADRVLLDVPCSGTGVLAKRADLRWQRSEDDLDALTTLQDELLDAAARLVRPGGLLVYSTCSIEPEENQHRVDAFLARHIDFTLEPVPVSDDLTSPSGFFQTLPHQHHVDGAFAACLRRVE